MTSPPDSPGPSRVHVRESGERRTRQELAVRERHHDARRSVPELSDIASDRVGWQDGLNPVTVEHEIDVRSSDRPRSVVLTAAAAAETAAEGALPVAAPRSRARDQRPQVRGKFLYVGDEKFWVRGVTYGAFWPDADGHEYHELEVIDRDFAQMVANGITAVRIPHTTPPRALLDVAQRHGLRVMVGLSAEQYVGFLIDTKGAPDIEALVRDKVRAVAGHPALLCYAIGNEIPGPVARWLGRQRVERYLRQLYWAIKAEDPGGLVTYVNYPTTEYLDLPFLDLVCFNVYLESPDRFDAYLARLHTLAGERPLIMSEVGLDAFRNGEEVQARALQWQIRGTFAAGCAGAFIFSWTDDWFRAGAAVDDWAFGLTDRDRRPKLALSAVCAAFSGVPFAQDRAWPRISVVVCSYNGARTMRDCLEGLCRLQYPDFEVIVVNDGSKDATSAIAHEYGFRVIDTENRGLSSARNTGLAAATGDIVAYIDDDAWPDPDWLTYVAATFMRSDYVGVGGPNIAPPGDGAIADCVANAPGGPIHVLLTDQEAEHLPGCNMAFRTTALRAIGGFDPRFRTAGDDVDLCWRLRERGGKLGFHPAAVVWHHRRNSVRAYWRQQRGYGRAEALLEQKWPEKYNAAGHLTWTGRIYGKGLVRIGGWPRARIYHGPRGRAPFQSLYQPAGIVSSLLLMPEWYLIIVALAVLSGLSALWAPFLYALPVLAMASGASLTQAVLSATAASFPDAARSRVRRLTLHGLTALLYLLQPLARLRGRWQHGLTPWRGRAPRGGIFPRRRIFSAWSERWEDPDKRAQAIETLIRADGAVVLGGGQCDRWDIEVRGGILGAARLLMAIEDHGAGRQLIRARSWPVWSSPGLIVILALGGLSLLAALGGGWSASAVLGATSVLLGVRAFQEAARSLGCVLRAAQQLVDAA